MAGAAIWEPKPAAYRDLVRLTLHRLGGELRDEAGGATALLLEKCGITKTSNSMSHLSAAVRAMETEGFIERVVERKRTYLFKLTVPLTKAEESLLSTKEGPNRAMCEKNSRPSEKHENGDWLTPLFDDCLKAQEALREAFRGADKATPRLAVFNATKVLEGVGLKSRRADEVRYYLREFGLARSTTKFEGDKHLWWWEVPMEKELDREKLRKKAMGPHAYGGFRRRAPLEDTSQTRRHARGVSAHLTDADCGPVSVRRKPVRAAIEDPVAPVPPEAEVTDFHAEESTVGESFSPDVLELGEETSRSRFEELISAAEELERALTESETERMRLLEDLNSKIRQHTQERERLASEHKTALEAQLSEFKLQLEQQDSAHREALEALQAELEKERARADEAQAELDQRADSLIQRVRRRWTSS